MKSKMKNEIIGISDVSLGFGSPQIQEFMKYLLKYYPEYMGKLLEPDQPEKPYKKDRYKEFEIKRLTTIDDVYSTVGRIEYIARCSEIVKKEKPKILVIFCSFCLPVLFKINYRAEKVFYYNIEMASEYGRNDIILNSNLSDKVDFLVYPEKNRAMLDIEKFGFRNIPYFEMYNCVNDESELADCVSPKERNGKIIYAGRIDSENTNARYFMGSDVENMGMEIDIFGNIAGSSIDTLKAGFLKLNGNVRYYGYIESEKLKLIRKKYAYSIIMWNPINENQYYAAPNKFFEAIADGVIPISAPHPQCKEIIRKYDCGILMRDWSYEAFVDALKIAKEIYGTGRYFQLVDNCRIAVKKEISWDKQIEKLGKYLSS